MASTTPYGYLKDKDDPNVWIVDEEATVVVRENLSHDNGRVRTISDCQDTERG